MAKIYGDADAAAVNGEADAKWQLFWVGWLREATAAAAAKRQTRVARRRRPSALDAGTKAALEAAAGADGPAGDGAAAPIAPGAAASLARSRLPQKAGSRSAAQASAPAGVGAPRNSADGLMAGANARRDAAKLRASRGRRKSFQGPEGHRAVVTCAYPARRLCGASSWSRSDSPRDATRRAARDVDPSVETSRGTTAATTRIIPRGRIATAPRAPRGHSAETRRGGAAVSVTTRRFYGDDDRRR